ncbi:MAG TPA: hypothetical protein VIR29_12310 [Anseongella sp.]
MPVAESMHLYEIFSKYFENGKDAKAAVNAIETISETKISAMLRRLLTKDDKVDLIREMKSDKSELVEMIHSNKSELVEIIHSNKTELIEKIQSNKTELVAMIGRSKVETIFWIVGLGIVQIALILFSKSLT